MSKSGIEALKKVLKSIESMSNEEFLEICDIASKRQEQYEKDMKKFNEEPLKQKGEHHEKN